MALEAFRRIQWGIESANGSPAAATRVGIGTLTVNPLLEWHRPSDERTSLAEYRRAAIVGQSTALSYEGAATYQQIIDWFAAAVKGGVSPSTSVNEETWTFTPSLTARNNQDAMTIEYGDDDQDWQVVFCTPTLLELSFVMNDVVNIRCDLVGRLATKATLTPALSEETDLEEIVATKLNIDINAVLTFPATANKTNLLAGAVWRLNTGLTPITYANGSLETHSAVIEARRHLEVDLDYAMGSDAMTEYDAALAGTERSIRLEVTGAANIDSNPPRLSLDVTGRYLEPPEIFGTRDGENLLSMTMASHEDSSGNEFSVEVLNEEGALGNV